ncbi:hypothetical protein [Actinokineospora globicatena]|uniref:Uncharacterized protein n=1 Tax=Actinokineospora globicatena TaxID=103729 RepID=A0A9W6QSK6_9PSEU|nr:hypothetical protein [Actinokineospora globicatena]GLW93899.1 hypothetical protein Aglo03_47150 [Actinokineospora globicatena]
MIGQRVARLLLAALVLASGGALMVPTAAAAQTTTPPAPSAVTVRGSGEFSALEFTVAQTKGLINQTVRLTWKGGVPTDGKRGYNFLQIMQCWGDDATGPRREQCQYGTPLAASYQAAATWSRSLSVTPKKLPPTQEERDGLLIDPLELTKQQEEKPGSATYLPFVPVEASGPPTKPSEPGYGLYYDANTTNEVQTGVTREDGRGELDFEVQTTLEAPGLDCGRLRTTGPDAGKARHCWLVVVPRGDTEVNGKKVTVPTPQGGHLHDYLDSSPLSQTNWNKRLSPIRLDFEPVGQSCPLGKAERPLSGNEFVADAVLRWQPALCSNDGPVFGFVQMPDRQARDLLGGDDPGMVFLAKPAAKGSMIDDRALVYAPVSVSAYTVAFIVERQPPGDAPDNIKVDDGKAFDQLKLTPRLVAKLITQSYGNAVPGLPDYLKGNPTRLSQDEDFLTLNPQVRPYTSLDMLTVDALLSSVDMDATESLWEWLLGDAEAKAWLSGTPDQWGMKVNKNYLALALPAQNFPKADLSCQVKTLNGLIAEFCANTRRPLAADMHEAGRSVNRGDSLGREPNGVRDLNDRTRSALGKLGRSVVGKRAMLAIVDTATARRYGLTEALLRNPAGEFVAPTDEAVLAGVAEMTASDTPGVKVTNPRSTAKGAYPLPALTYAATAPSMLTKDSGKDYARLLRYVTTSGQTPGEGAGKLPAGYVPLPQALRDQADATAAVVERDAGIKPPVEPEPAQGESDVDTGSESGSDQPDTSTPTPDAETGAPAPAPAPTPAADAKPSEDKSTPVAQSKYTPSTPVTWVLRYLLAGLLITGGLTAAAGPVLTRLGARARVG